MKEPVMYKRNAKKISWSGDRELDTVTALVFHFTANKGDTAKNNADFFATGNTRKAGAHLFVSRNGDMALSVPLKKSANAVGGLYSQKKGAGKYYRKVTNANSISIELCDCLKGPSWEQMLASRELYLWLKGKCPKLKTVVRHWDVNGKECPGPMTGKENKKWEHFRSKVVNNYQYKAKVVKDAAIRSSKGVKPKNKTSSVKKGKVVTISKISGNWGRILKKDSQGRWQWISLKKVKEI